MCLNYGKLLWLYLPKTLNVLLVKPFRLLVIYHPSTFQHMVMEAKTLQLYCWFTVRINNEGNITQDCHFLPVNLHCLPSVSSL